MRTPPKDDNPIESAFYYALAQGGFSKKADTWLRQEPETILVINLQKSQYGKQYYINLGVWVRSLGDPAMKFPKERICHLRIRIDALLPEQDAKRSEKLLNLEDESFTSKIREGEITRMISDIAIPFLSKCSTIAGIRIVIREQLLKQRFVHRDLVQLITQG